MNIAQTLDQAADSLERVNWKQVTKELIELWDLIWKILILSIIFTHLAGKSLGNWVHSTNDRLAANWVRLIVVPPTPAEVEQTPITVVAEEVSVPTPTPIVEVELKLPTVKAEVVEILVLDEQPPPTARRRRRGSAPRSQEVTVTEHKEVQVTKKPRGPKAHSKRIRRTLAT